MQEHTAARATFQRYEYDHVFLQEKRGEGTMEYQAPDRFKLTIGPPSEDFLNRPSKKGGTGQQFVVEPERPATWYLDNHELIVVDPESHSYDVLPMPYWMQTISQAPIEKIDQHNSIPDENDLMHPLRELPQSIFTFGLREMFATVPGAFLCGYELATAQGRFTWTGKKESEERIQLSGMPKGSFLTRNFSQVDVMLDASTHRTTAMRIIDPGGSKETVYVITALQQGDATLFVRPPYLKGFRNSQMSNGDQESVEESDSERSILPIACAILATVVLLQAL